MAPLYWGLNPVSLAQLSTAGRERIDLLIDYLNKQLFRDLTYAALHDGKPHPLLILNAADMVEGVPFPFTQRKFDLLCSDLTQFPLATAVASSAAFPIALSPVTLETAVELLSLPDRIRGYGPVKEEAATVAKARHAQLTADLASPPPAPRQIAAE